MSTNTAPSPDFTGIDFNDMFFPSAVGDFVEYPVAQGTVSFGSIYASFIDTISSSASFSLLNSLTGNLNLATNGGTGQTIRVGAYTLASVHCANIDHQNNSINHATNASGGTINICNNQTTGTLNIGTNTTRSGNLNIGNGVGSTGGIFIGVSGNTTTLGGTVSATNGLSLASGQYITTNHAGTVTAPTSAQVGGIVSATTITSTPPTSSTVSSLASVSLTPGTWILSATRQYNNSQNSSRINFAYGDTLRSNATISTNDTKYGMVTVPLNNQINYANLTGIVSLTASATVYLNVYMEYTTAGTVGTANFVFNAVRIA